MTSIRTLFSSVLVASSLGLIATPSVAAAPKCGPPGEHGDFMGHHTKSMERHHAKLHDALKLTPDQEGVWKAMLDAEPPMASQKNEDWAKLTTPERAENMLERMREHQALLTEHVVAIKAFYSVLTPEQKKVFDDFHSGPHPGMHGKSVPRPAKAPVKP